jgi:hypothetical protein
MADLDQIMSERPQEHDSNQPERQEAPQQVEQQGQPRDEHGRFAGQQQQPAPEAPPPEPAKPPEGYVPIQALDARLSKAEEKYQNMLREQALDFQRQMAALQQQHQPKPEPPKPVDFFENPDAAFESRMQQAMQPVQQGQQQIVENFSRMMAADKHGEEAVNAALAEMTRRVNANPQAMRFDYQRIMAAPHPYGELVKWHKAQTALSEIGDDPKAFREKLRAELLAEIQGGQQQQQPPQAPDPNSLPSSFNRNSGPSAVPQWNGPRPLSDLMGR